jgi:hypothetical protein
MKNKQEVIAKVGNVIYLKGNEPTQQYFTSKKLRKTRSCKMNKRYGKVK